MFKIHTPPVVLWSALGVIFYVHLGRTAENKQDSFNIKKAALEELSAQQTTTPMHGAPVRKSHPVEIEDNAQGVLKLSNPYNNEQTRAYKIHMALMGQKYQARGTFKQDVGPDIRLNAYPELILPSLEFATDKSFSSASNFSWGAHINASFMTQNQRFTLGVNKTKTEDAQLNTFIAQIGPNLKYRLWERVKWAGQVSVGAFQQTQTSSSAFLRNSQTKSIWSASTGPEILLSKGTLLILRYEYRALLADAETVAIQNDNAQLGLGYIW